MASYGSFARSARFAFRSSGRSTFRASGGRSQPSSNARPPLSSQRTSSGSNIANFRRRYAQSMIPLHDAVAAARLVSHLGVNSRSRSALPLGLDSLASGRIRAPFQGNLGNHSERFKYLGTLTQETVPRELWHMEGRIGMRLSVHEEQHSGLQGYINASFRMLRNIGFQ